MSAPDSFAGKSARCPKCGSQVTFSPAPPELEPQKSEDDFDELLADDEARQKDEWDRKAQKRSKKDEERKPAQRMAAGSRGTQRYWIAGGAALALFGLGLVAWLVLSGGEEAGSPGPAITASDPEPPQDSGPVNPASTAPAVAAPAVTDLVTPPEKTVELPPADAGVAWPDLTSVVQVDPTSGRILARRISTNSLQACVLFEPSYMDGDEKAWRPVTFQDYPVTAAAFKRWGEQDCLVISALRPSTSPASVLYALIDSKTFELVPPGPDLINPIVLDEVSVSAHSLSVTEMGNDLQVVGGHEGLVIFADLQTGTVRNSYSSGTNSHSTSFSRTGRYIHRNAQRSLNSNRGLHLDDVRDFIIAGLPGNAVGHEPYDQMLVSSDQKDSSRHGIRPFTSSTADLALFPPDTYFQGFMQNRPWLIAKDSDEVLWLSRESGQIVARRPLPILHANWVFDDPANQRMVVIGGSKRAGVLKYDDSFFPRSDALVATIDLPARVPPGQTISVPIQSPTPGLKVSLIDPPASAKIENGSLVWTPTVNEIGPARFLFRFELGVDVRDQVEEAIVSRFPLKLPFSPDGFRVSADGNRIVAWQDFQRIPFQSEWGPPRLALYDLEKERVLAVTELQYRVLDVQIAGDQVVVLAPHPWGEKWEFQPRTGQFLAVYRLSDLTWEQTHRFSTPIIGILPIGPSSLAVHLDKTLGNDQPIWPLRDGHLNVYRIPEMTLEPWSHLIAPYNMADGKFLRNADGHWLVSGMTLSADATKIEHYTHPHHWTFRSPSLENREVGPTSPIEEAIVSFQYGLNAQGAWSTAHNAKVSWDHFIAQLNLDLRNETRVIPVTHTTRENIPPNRAQASACSRGILCLADGLHLIPREELEGTLPAPPRVEGKTPAPIRIQPVPNQILVESGDRLKFDISGGTPPYDVKFFAGNTGSFDALELDPVDNNRAVVIKFGKLQAKLANQLSDLLVSQIGFPGKEPADILKEYLSRMNEEFSFVFDKPARQPILPSVVGVVVTDAAGRSEFYLHSIFLQFPPGDLLKRMQEAIQMGRTSARPIGLTPRRNTLPTLNVLDPNPQTAIELSRKLRVLRTQVDPRRSDVPEEILKQPVPIQAARSLTHSFRNADFRQPESRAPETEIQRSYNQGSVSGKLIGVEGNRLRIGVKYQNRLREEQVYLEQLTSTEYLTAWSDILTCCRERGALGRHSRFARIRNALRQFHAGHSVLPPSALVSSKGQPLLSWRVLILAELGYKDLYQLFHLDEPWDSPHNIQLLDMMPLEYSISQGPLPAGKTTVMGLLGQDAAFTVEKLRRVPDSVFREPGKMVVSQVADSEAQEWTKPVDWNVDEKGHPLETGMEPEVRNVLGFDGTVRAYDWRRKGDDWPTAAQLREASRLSPP